MTGIMKIDLSNFNSFFGKKYSRLRKIPEDKTATVNHPTKLPMGTPK